MNPRKIHSIVSALLIVPALFAVSRVQAQLVRIETVSVGDANNVAYSHSSSDAIGSVAYRYEIGKYEVTLTQYAAFLNAVAKFNGASYLVNLWDSQLQFDNNVAGIARSGSGSVGDPYVYTVIGDGDRPVSNRSWFDSARFANWLNNGATAGASTETGSYTLNGATNGFINPNASAVWRLPSADEWFKAAYYKGGGTNAGYWRYATRSDVSPNNVVGGAINQANYRVRGRYAVTQSTTLDGSQNYLTTVGAFTGNPSAYNTFDQTGNVSEWTDGLLVFAPPGVPAETNRAAFGGSWMENFDVSSFEATAVDRNARFGALPETPVFGFRLVKITASGPSPKPTPTPSLVPAITSPVRAAGAVGKVFSYQIAASNQPTGYAATGLPAGLRINQKTGVITGRPARAGRFNVTVSATNAGGKASKVLSLNVGKGAQLITFKLATTQKFKKGRTLTLAATSSSKLSVAFQSSNPRILSIRGNKATIHRKGNVTITASQRGNAHYLAAKQVPRKVTVK